MRDKITENTNKKLQDITKWIELRTTAEKNYRRTSPEFDGFQKKSENYQKIFNKSGYTVEQFISKQTQLQQFTKQISTLDKDQTIV